MTDELQLAQHELDILSKVADEELLVFLSANEEDMWSGYQIDDRMFDLNIFGDEFCTEGHVACIIYECDKTDDDNWTTNTSKCYHLWERKIELLAL